MRHGQFRRRDHAVDQLGEGAVQAFDDRLLGQVQMLAAPVAGGMQHPGIERAVPAWLAAVACHPIQRVVLDETAFQRGIQRIGETQGHRPGRLHRYTRGHGSQFWRAGQQCGGLRSRGGDDHMTERAMAGARSVDQRPEAFAAEYFGDAAAEGHRQFTQQASGNRAHGRCADPAQLLVGRRLQLAFAGLEQGRGPLLYPAAFLPLAHDLAEAAIARREVLRAEV